MLFVDEIEEDIDYCVVYWFSWCCFGYFSVVCWVELEDWLCVDLCYCEVFEGMEWFWCEFDGLLCLVLDDIFELVLVWCLFWVLVVVFFVFCVLFVVILFWCD